VRVVVGTGGTAGHVFPALAAAESLRDRLGAEVEFLGRAEGLEARLVPEAGFPMRTVEALPFARKLSLTTLRAPLAALRAARRCGPAVRGADAVLGMGGYVSVPVSLAARRERVPLVLHEQNAIPGLANRVASRWARVVALSFPGSADRFPRKARTVVTGNPVRASVLRVREEWDSLRAEGLRRLELDPERRTVVAFGGSQGARRLNRATVEACRLLADRGDLQVVLLTGHAHHAEATEELAAEGLAPAGHTEERSLLVRARAFLDGMELAYAAADLVVCRAGATTVAEVTACALPAVMVPYPYATARHQDANAEAVVRSGGAVAIGDGELDGRVLAERIRELIDDRDRLATMARGSAAFGRPGAADALADLTAEIAGARV
jgi:UDP-N-acetylglucosamine--N-acetylmuramyl-(pentapeptide) pyrophosphoryl-undecaprenol N-acetylglucosamine transferase